MREETQPGERGEHSEEWRHLSPDGTSTRPQNRAERIYDDIRGAVTVLFLSAFCGYTVVHYFVNNPNYLPYALVGGVSVVAAIAAVYFRRRAQKRN